MKGRPHFTRRKRNSGSRIWETVEQYAARRQTAPQGRQRVARTVSVGRKSVGRYMLFVAPPWLPRSGLPWKTRDSPGSNEYRSRLVGIDAGPFLSPARDTQCGYYLKKYNNIPSYKYCNLRLFPLNRRFRTERSDKRVKISKNGANFSNVRTIGVGHFFPSVPRFISITH